MDPVGFATPRGGLKTCPINQSPSRSNWWHSGGDDEDAGFFLTPRNYDNKSTSVGSDDSSARNLPLVARALFEENTAGEIPRPDESAEGILESRTKTRMSECEHEQEWDLEEDNYRIWESGNDTGEIVMDTDESKLFVLGRTPPSVSSSSILTVSSSGNDIKHVKRSRQTTDVSSSSDQDRKSKGLKKGSHHQIHQTPLAPPPPPPPPQQFLKYACPYRKHDPHKYDLAKWPKCAISNWPTTSRVKEHLYRSHRVLCCQRCNQQFKHVTELDSHLTASIGCDLRSWRAPEGITEAMERKLKRRKKAHQDQTESERWMQIYSILFPSHPLPESPYFDPIPDETALHPRSLDLEGFASFSREELPRILRSHIGEESDLKSMRFDDLLSVIQSCQDEIMSNYTYLHKNSAAPSTTCASTTYASTETSRTSESNATPSLFDFELPGRDHSRDLRFNLEPEVNWGPDGTDFLGLGSYGEWRG